MLLAAAFCFIFFFKSSERGEFLALDLGGTHFRVLLVKVMADGEQKVEMENQIYAIPEHLMKGSGAEVRAHATVSAKGTSGAIITNR